MNKNNALLGFVIITMSMVFYVAYTNTNERRSHFEETQEFKQEIRDLLEFKKKGERFTAEDGRKLQAQIDELKRLIDDG